MCPCLACRIPLLESTVNENTRTAESAEKLSSTEMFNLYNMDLQYKVVNLNLVSGHEWTHRVKLKGRKKH